MLFLTLLLNIIAIGYYIYEFMDYYDSIDNDNDIDTEWIPSYCLYIEIINIYIQL